MATLSALTAFSKQFERRNQPNQPPPMEVCLGWTMPPAAAVASAQSFEGVLDVAERFRTIRAENQRGTMVAKHQQQQQQQSKASTTATFITCLLHVIHPMSRLMSAADMARMQARYVEAERATVVQCAHSVAQEYHTHVLKRVANPTVDAVRDSIVRDPSRAFTDEGLNHAVVYYLTQRMAVAVVMRSGPPGSACLTFLPKGSAESATTGSLPCVLITRDGRGDYRIEHEGPRMTDVWAHLRSDMAVRASLEDARARMDRLTLPAIQPLAAMLGMALGGGEDPRATASAFGGKAGLLKAVFGVGTAT
jgi:hypothetical protein